jgi:protein SCO1/2
MRRALLLLAWICGAAFGQPLELPAPPRAGLEQHVGSQVPLDVRVTDEDGLHRALGNYVDGTRPVLLVPGYYRCAQLCGLVMQSLLDSLHASGVPRSGWRIVAVSIDPRETPADARRRRDVDLAYADSLLGAKVPKRRLDLRLLTLAPDALDRVARAIGIRFETVRDAKEVTIAHPATVVVLTPAGGISRYFNGVGIDGDEMRVALADASGDRIGGVTARIALLCAHFDPRVGRLDDAVMNAIRALAAVLVIALGTWCWRRRSR